MFNTLIENVAPFWEKEYQQAAASISGDKYKGDDTMVSTLRVLLFERLGGSSLSYHYHHHEVVDMDFTDLPKAFDQLFPKVSPYSLNITSIYGSEDGTDAALSAVKQMPGFKPVNDVSAYMEQKTDTRVTVLRDDQTCCCCVLVKNLTNATYHLLQSMIRRFFTVLFESKPATDEEMAFLKSCSFMSASNYRKHVELLAEKVFKTEVARLRILDVVQRFKRVELDGAQRNVDRKKDEMEAVRGRYAETLRELEEAIIRYEGIRAMAEKDDTNTEFAQYLSGRKEIDIIGSSESCLKLIVRTYLDIFDPDAFESFCRTGEIFRNYESLPEPFDQEENRKLLLTNLFSHDPTLHIRMCGYYNLDFRGSVSTESSYSYGSEYADYLPNPHLDRHACLGGNNAPINDAIRRGNLVGAIEQCVASAMSVNLDETSITFRPMLEKMFKSANKIIETMDGIQMTPAEALEWLQN